MRICTDMRSRAECSFIGAENEHVHAMVNSMTHKVIDCIGRSHRIGTRIGPIESVIESVDDDVWLFGCVLDDDAPVCTESVGVVPESV